SAEYDSPFIARPLRNDPAARATNKTLSPDPNSTPAAGLFVTNAVRRRHVTAVRNRVTALDRFPGVMLGRAEFLFLARMPADRRWVKNNFRAAQRGHSPRFPIPLVPANNNTKISAGSFPRLKSEIAGREIKFLVIKRIVRDVHLAIFAKKFSIRVDDRGGVVINAGHALLEKRRDNRDAELLR